MSNRSIFNFQQEITLLDGNKAVLRPICSADKNALLAFHSRLSADTRFLRYQYLKGELTEEDLKTFCEVDYDNTLALVAEVEHAGQKEVIGVGRYYRLPDEHSAEVAFVVQDSEQRKGLGTQLLKRLAMIAQQNDINYFVAEVLRINGKMLSIFRKSDPGMKYIIGDSSTCTIIISVAEAANRCP